MSTPSQSRFDTLPGRISTGIDGTYGGRKLRKAVMARLLLVTFAVLLVAGARAFGQTKFLFYSSSNPNGGPVPDECRTEAAVLREHIAAFPHPDTWTWVIACDEAAWRAVEVKLGVLIASRQAGQEIFAETDRQNKRTFIRGYTLAHLLIGFSGATPEHIVAHELAHAVLDSGDERLVDEQAARWIRERRGWKDGKDGNNKTLVATK